MASNRINTCFISVSLFDAKLFQVRSLNMNNRHCFLGQMHSHILSCQLLTSLSAILVLHPKGSTSTASTSTASTSTASTGRRLSASIRTYGASLTALAPPGFHKLPDLVQSVHFEACGYAAARIHLQPH